MSITLSGISLRDKIKEELSTIVSFIPQESLPHLAIVQVGLNEASTAYINGKIKFGREIGIPVILHPVAETATTEEVIDLVLRLNGEAETEGVIVQLPLPFHVDKEKILESIDPEKDVDGMTSINVKKLLRNDPSGIMPATTRGILSLLDFNSIPLKGKRVLTIGRSDLVGKPTAIALLNRDATVTIAHHKSVDLPSLCKEAEIIISAAGVPGLITKDHVKQIHVIIDVGITKVDGKIVGDVSSEEVSPLVEALSPVPGGVGPLTIASLFQNLLRKYTGGTITN